MESLPLTGIKDPEVFLTMDHFLLQQLGITY